MAKRKLKYYKKARLLPKWNDMRRIETVFNNKMMKYSNIERLKYIDGHDVSQYRLRYHTIPSSLIKKAITCNDHFRYYYDIIDVYSAGIAVEQVVLSLFTDLISKGTQVFSRKNSLVIVPT